MTYKAGDKLEARPSSWIGWRPATYVGPVAKKNHHVVEIEVYGVRILSESNMRPISTGERRFVNFYQGTNAMQFKDRRSALIYAAENPSGISAAAVEVEFKIKPITTADSILTLAGVKAEDVKCELLNFHDQVTMMEVDGGTNVITVKFNDGSTIKITDDFAYEVS